MDELSVTKPLDERILYRLDRIAEGIEGISAIMKKPPESKIKNTMELAGFCVTILGLVSIVDIVRSWILGG
jgi:hypothetical protein